MSGGSDWQEWHEGYRDPGSALNRRLRLVQEHIVAWLDARPGERLRAVSVCAGDGRDLIGVLTGRADADRVDATLVELDPRLAAAGRAAAREAGLTGVEVVAADAGRLAVYSGRVPADLVLLVGVLGNVSDDDARRTIALLPQLCAPGATVVWSRGRRQPELPGAVRGWFADSGFTELAFAAPADVVFTVGVHRLDGPARPLSPSGTLFTFTR